MSAESDDVVQNTVHTAEMSVTSDVGNYLSQIPITVGNYPNRSRDRGRRSPFPQPFVNRTNITIGFSREEILPDRSDLTEIKCNFYELLQF